MKKSVLSIVAIAFAAVSVFTSCDKNDDGYGQSAKTTTVASQSTDTSTNSSTSSSTSSYSFKGKAFFIDEEMAQLGTFKIEVSDGTKTSEYDLVAQGVHYTKTFYTYEQQTSVTATGYLLKVVLPTSGTLQFKVTFVPSEKAKSLTENDRVNGVWAVATGKGQSADINFDFTAHKNAKILGDKALDWCERVAQKMAN